VARYTQIISKASAWTLLITIVILSLVPAHDRPVTALPHSLEHLTIFFAAGLAFGIGYPQRRLFQFVALLAFTAAIELAQLLVPGRHARLSDFLIDAGGNCWSVDWLPRLAQAHGCLLIAGVTLAHRVWR
jgi:VanZ family protein